MRSEEGLRTLKAYKARYDKENTKQIKFKFNNKTDADILEKLGSLSNKTGYIKRLIREDIARNKDK